MENTTLVGRITLGNYTNIDEEHEDKEVFIELTDYLSGVTFAEVHMSIKSFAKVILGQGYIPMTFKLRGLDKVGKHHEVKTESILIDKQIYPGRVNRELVDSILKELEVDGWVADRDCFENWHKHNNGLVMVNFHRFVDVLE